MKNEAIIMLREIKWYFHALITRMKESKCITKKRRNWIYKFAETYIGRFVSHNKIINFFMYPVIAFCIVSYITTGFNVFNICVIGFAIGLITISFVEWINRLLVRYSFFYIAKHHDDDIDYQSCN